MAKWILRTLPRGLYSYMREYARIHTPVSVSKLNIMGSQKWILCSYRAAKKASSW